jgi:hypothetical protein
VPAQRAFVACIASLSAAAAQIIFYRGFQPFGSIGNRIGLLGHRRSAAE